MALNKFLSIFPPLHLQKQIPKGTTYAKRREYVRRTVLKAPKKFFEQKAGKPRRGLFKVQTWLIRSALQENLVEKRRNKR